MCGIAGFCNYRENYNQGFNGILRNMHKGKTTTYLEKCVGFAADTGNLGRSMDGKCLIAYEGELYNKNVSCEDAEYILKGYLEKGIEFVNELNGVFAFAIYDERLKKLFIVRDRIGTKPLFYSVKGDTIIFASELKGMFAHPFVEAKINMDSFRQLLGIGPAKIPSKAVFCDINEIEAGYYGVYGENGFNLYKYWDLEAKEHRDSYEKTVENVRYLLEDSIERQMVSDTGICSFLSGGIDSTIVTAVAAKKQPINTYSFDFVENDKCFVANAFQPERDVDYVRYALNHIKSNHKYLFCDDAELFNALFESVRAKGLPGMADIDASLLHFCKEVKKQDNIALTGECSDEIFGGYPWFYKEELLNSEGFPWSKDMMTREMLLQDDFAKKLELREYAFSYYEDGLKKVPRLYGEDKETARRREIGYLNIKWFMQTLLDRMDRAGRCNDFTARVPFADYRLVEYLYNVPWSMKRRNEVEKSLLRDAFKDVLPERLLNRKKSPYPKTYSKLYEQMLKDRLVDIMDDKDSILHTFIDKRKVLEYIKEPTLYGKPWFGQLMAAPQMLAYLIQIDYWVSIYKPVVV